MPRARACPSCGQMCLISGFAFHVKQCSRRQAVVEVPCPFCDKLFRQFELADHARNCPQNASRSKQSVAVRSSTTSKQAPSLSRIQSHSDRVQAPIEAAAPVRLASGDRVVVGGLKSKPEWNGAEGFVVGSYNASRERYRVRLQSAENVRGGGGKGVQLAEAWLKPENLRRKSSGNGILSSSQSKANVCAGSSAMAAQIPSTFVASGGGLVPCAVCGRTFAPDRIARHQQACKKAATGRRRTTFDSAGQRAAGQEIFTRVAVQKSGHKGRAILGNSMQRHGGKWREEHAQFQAFLRDAKQSKSGSRRSPYMGSRSPASSGRYGPPSQTSEPSHYVPCPHCGRTFAPQAAARHIPACATTFARPKPPPRAAAAMRHQSLIDRAAAAATSELQRREQQGMRKSRSHLGGGAGSAVVTHYDAAKRHGNARTPNSRQPTSSLQGRRPRSSDGIWNPRPRSSVQCAAASGNPGAAWSGSRASRFGSGGYDGVTGLNGGTGSSFQAMHAGAGLGNAALAPVPKDSRRLPMLRR